MLATPADYRMVESTLKKLDLVPLQVLIEATIAEVRLTDDLRYGLQWFFSEGKHSATLSSVAAALPGQVFPGFSYLFAGNSMRVVLNALDDISDVKVISSPTLMVLDNQTASLQVGGTVPILRVRPETLCRITEFSEHESNGREFDEGERVAVEVLPVLGQSAAAVEPGDGAFDHPTPGLDDEALHPIGSLDDLGLEIGQDAGQGAVKDRALIGAVGEQFPEKGKQTEQGRQQRETAVAILNVGGGDDAVQQQALRIDQNMPLLALDQLAGIEAVAVDASPPFSALFTL